MMTTMMMAMATTTMMMTIRCGGGVTGVAPCRVSSIQLSGRVTNCWEEDSHALILHLSSFSTFSTFSAFSLFF